jgi:hypothetical protein
MKGLKVTPADKRFIAQLHPTANAFHNSIDWSDLPLVPMPTNPNPVQLASYLRAAFLLLESRSNMTQGTFALEFKKGGMERINQLVCPSAARTTGTLPY